VNSLPKTVTRQRRDCDLNPCSSEPESSTLTTRLPAPIERRNYHELMISTNAQCYKYAVSNNFVSMEVTPTGHGRDPNTRLMNV